MLGECLFRNAHGLFSFERIDAGSRLRVDNLPSDIKGKVADFCACLSDVAAEVVTHAKSLTAFEVFEANFEALEATKAKVPAVLFKPGLHWKDLSKERVEQRYDVVVVNTPFNQNRDADPKIGRRMIRAAATELKPARPLFMVAKHHLPYQLVL